MPPDVVAPPAPPPPTAGGAPQQERTGGQRSDVVLGWLREDRVRASAQRYPLLNTVLMDDFAEENRAFQAGETTYAEYKPLVLHFEAALDKIIEGLGFVTPQEGVEASGDATRVFDTNSIAPSKILDGVADLVECLAKKPRVRRAFFQQLSPELRAKWSGLLGGGPRPGGGRPTPAETQRAASNATAIIDLVVGLLRLWADLRAFREEDAPAGPAELQELLENIATIIAAVFALVYSENGGRIVRGIARHMGEPANADGLADRRERLSGECDRLRGLSPERCRAEAETRATTRRQADRVSARTPEARSRADELQRVLKGVASLAGAIWSVIEAWGALSPSVESLAGDWEVSGAPGGYLWTLRLAQAAGGTFEGRLAATGFPPQSRAGIVREVREEKAAVVFSSFASGWWQARISPLPTPLTEPHLTCVSDAFFARGSPISGAVGVTDARNMTFTPPFAPVLFAPGQVVGWTISRPANLKKVVDLAMAVFKVFAALWESLPQMYREPIQVKVEEMFNPWIARIRGAIPSYVLASLAGGKLTLGIQREGYGNVSARWDIWDIVQGMIAAVDRPDVQRRSPLVPEAFQGTLTIRGVEVGLELTTFDPVADAAAGTQGIEDALGWSEWKARLDKYVLEDLGARYDILEPTLRATEEGGLPVCDFPIVVYKEEFDGETVLGADGSVTVRKHRVNLKLTIKVGITAEVLALYMPQLRAVLFAWRMGWAAGTMLRGQLLRSPAYRAAESRVQDWIAENIFGYEGHQFQQAVIEVDGIMSQLAQAGHIHGFEQTIAGVKSPFYVWAEVYEESSDPTRLQEPPFRYNPEYLLVMQRTAHRCRDRLRAARTAQGAPGPVAAGGPIPRDQDPYDLDSVAAAEIAVHLLQSTERLSRERLLEEIAESVRQCEILEARGLLYQAVVYPERFDELKNRILNLPLPDPTSVRSLEFRLIRTIVQCPAYRRWIDIVSTGIPTTEWVDGAQILYSRAEGRVLWRVTRSRPNERVLIRFIETEYNDSVLEMREGYTAQRLVDRHFYEGNFREFSRSLRREASGDQIEVYIQVLEDTTTRAGTRRDARVLYQSDFYTLRLEGGTPVEVVSTCRR